jgi:hypothetical protein
MLYLKVESDKTQARVVACIASPATVAVIVVLPVGAIGLHALTGGGKPASCTFLPAGQWALFEGYSMGTLAVTLCAAVLTPTFALLGWLYKRANSMDYYGNNPFRFR